MKYKPNFEETKKYSKAFWQMEVIDRPLIAVTAPKDPKDLPQWVPYLTGAKDGDFLSGAKRYAAFAEKMYFAGEAVPAFECSFGPDQYAAFFGGHITLAEDGGTSWVHPFKDTLEGVKLELDTKPGSYFNMLKRGMKACADYAKGDFLINMIDLHGNIDALSAMRGPQNLCMDLYDATDAVVEAQRQVVDTYPYVVGELAKAAQMDKYGYTGWAPTFSEERFAVLQCDFSCMPGPEFVRKYILPELEREASFLKNSVYHFDGKEALGHMDDILAADWIKVIQWVPGSGAPRSLDWMDLLKKIQKAGKGLWLYDWSADEIKARHKELKPEGLIFSCGVGTPQEADALIKAVKL